MKLLLACMLLLQWWTGCTTVSAQQNGSPALDEVLWRQIENNLQQQPSDAFVQSTTALVRSHCGADYTCLRQMYIGIMYRLERRFRLSAAIQVGEELVRIARGQRDRATEADAYLNLNRFHSALGNTRQAVESLNKATRIFEQTDNRPAITHARMTTLEQSLEFRPLEDVFPEMQALLAESEANRDTPSLHYLHIRLLMQAQTLGRYEEMEKHIVALENVPLSDPIRPNEYGMAIHAAMGRADLAMVRNHPAEAERYYQKTLRLCEAEPSRWLEIHVLLALSGLEWERKNAALAKAYLGKAESKAGALELHDLLTRVCAAQADIAEAEGRYADALRYTKEKAVHEAGFREKSAGFDLKNYYLELEKDRLDLENKNRKLELGLRKTQLRNTLVILALAFLLAAGFIFAYARQRRQKRVLTEQNSLISKQADELRSLDRLKSRFFANISHELRTPLTLILGPVEHLLTDKPKDPVQTNLLETVRRNATRLLSMVNEILELHKLEAAPAVLKIQNTQVHGFLQEIVHAFLPLAESRKVSLTLQGTSDPDWVAGFDRDKTETILRNLLSNALRFTPAGGAVTVSAVQLPDGVQIAVRDTGPGIHPDDLPHIFELYYQSKRPDTSAQGGTGIGLTLSRELATAMGGRLWAENNPDRGCIFFLQLPAIGAAMGAPAMGAPARRATARRATARVAPTIVHRPSSTVHHPPSTVHRPPSTVHLLLVEDNPDLLDFLCSILQDEYRVSVAANGREALEWLEGTAELPDLILTDWMMPEMDGLTLIGRLREREAWRAIPVILLTARAGQDDRLRVFRIGIDDYIVKPFVPEELQARIANALRNLEARREWQALSAGAPEVIAPESAPAEEQDWLSALQALIRANIGDPQFNIDQLAELKGMSRSTFYRQIREKTGMSANQLVQEIRLQVARELLESGQYASMRALAEAVGFRTPNYFSRLYRERFGKSPLG